MRTFAGNELILPIFACFQVNYSLFYYLRKISENICFSDVFKGVQKGNVCLKYIQVGELLPLSLRVHLSICIFQLSYLSGVCRGISTPVYWFGRPNYVPKSKKKFH